MLFGGQVHGCRRWRGGLEWGLRWRRGAFREGLVYRVSWYLGECVAYSFLSFGVVLHGSSGAPCGHSPDLWFGALEKLDEWCPEAQGLYVVCVVDVLD